MFCDYIKPENVIVNLESSDKDCLFAEMTEVLIRSMPKLNRDEVVSSLVSREEQMNTCVMKGIAVTHAECDSVSAPVVAIGISDSGVDYDIDGVSSKDFNETLVHVVFMMLFEKGNAERHLRILADCARILNIPGFYKALLGAKTAQDVCNLIREYETSY